MYQLASQNDDAMLVYVGQVHVSDNISSVLIELLRALRTGKCPKNHYRKKA